METSFSGVFTAIVTPFHKDGSIAWDHFRKLIEFQISSGVGGIVPCGTTGESPTLSHDEQLQMIANTVRWVSGRCKVVAGTGSNNTAHAVELSTCAENLGADGLLVVNPYYNKPTQEGLFRHFAEVAKAVKIPVMVYNIKGRTAVNIETKTLARLWSEYPNIAAVKEASGDLNQMKDVLASCPKNFSVLSGDDNLTLELIRAGGKGVVSVASNAMPQELAEFVAAALSKDWSKAQAYHERLMPFFEGIFVETNPIPIKAVLSMMGKCEENYRLPMCELRPENRKKIETLVRTMKLV